MCFKCGTCHILCNTAISTISTPAHRTKIIIRLVDLELIGLELIGLAIFVGSKCHKQVSLDDEFDGFLVRTGLQKFKDLDVWFS